MNAARRGSGWNWGTATSYLGLSVLAFIALAPLVVLGFNALKDPAEIGRNPLGPPTAPNIGNFAEAWQQGRL